MQKARKHVSLDVTSSQGGYFGSRRQGGISNIPIAALTSYLDFIISARDRVVNKEWLPSVRDLSILINEDPVLRMNW